MSLKVPEPPFALTNWRVGSNDGAPTNWPATVNDEPAAIVPAKAVGAIARAVADATKARENLFIVTSWSRPCGRLYGLGPLQRAGQRLNCSFNGLRVEVRTISDATGPCAKPFCALPGAYRFEFGKPGGYTLAGKEYADPTSTPTVCAYSYAHGGPKILHLDTATYGGGICETCKFLRTHVLKRFPLPRIGWDWE